MCKQNMKVQNIKRIETAEKRVTVEEIKGENYNYIYEGD